MVWLVVFLRLHLRSYLCLKMGNAKYKQKHKEQGLCRDCSRPAIPMRAHCMICNEKYRLHNHKNNFTKEQYAKRLQATREHKKRYRETNRCPQCSAPKGEQDEGFISCVNCRLNLHSSYSPVMGKPLEDYYKSVAEQP